MAVTPTGQSATAEAWTAPMWPEGSPDPSSARVVYGSLADELVVRFAGTTGRRGVAVAIETPDRDYAFLLADDETGVVVDVQVDDLLALAIRMHPRWTWLADTTPSTAVIAAFPTDIAELFARYGAGETPSVG